MLLNTWYGNWFSNRKPKFNVSRGLIFQLSCANKPMLRWRTRPMVAFGPYVLLSSPSTTERVMEETRPVNSAYRFSALVRSDEALPGKLVELNIVTAGSVL